MGESGYYWTPAVPSVFGVESTLVRHMKLGHLCGSAALRADTGVMALPGQAGDEGIRSAPFEAEGERLFLRTHQVGTDNDTWSNGEATLTQVSFPSQCPSHASREHKEVSRGL